MGCLALDLLDRRRFALLEDFRPCGVASADRRGASAAVGEPRGGILPLAGFFGFGVEVQASVAERVAEVLKHIVGRFAGLAPRARVRARSKRVSWNVYIPVYV